MKMRSMQPKDMPRLIQFHVEQNQRDGTNYPLPRMFDALGVLDTNIALALTVEHRDEAVQGIYFQSRLAEMCFAGCNPRATAFARREINGVRYVLRRLGFEGIRCLIPQVRVDQLEGPMLEAGFLRRDSEFALFSLDL